jgi:hypothetical protein
LSFRAAAGSKCRPDASPALRLDEAIGDVLATRLLAWPLSVGLFERAMCPGLKIFEAVLAGRVRETAHLAAASSASDARASATAAGARS